MKNDVYIGSIFSKVYEQNPIVLVDVGASGGMQTNWSAIDKYLYMIGFEPDEREFINSQNQCNEKVKILNTGLYKEKSTVTYNLTRKQSSSSIFKPNRDFLNQFPESSRYDIVGETKVNMDTLDNQLSQANITNIDFVKIDTEGSELFVLEGARQSVENSAFGLELEVSFSEIFSNQPLFSKVDDFVRGMDFQLFDIQTSHWKREKGKRYGNNRGQLIFGNALYFRRLDSFIVLVEKINNKEKQRSKVLNAITICVLYGYVDYAFELYCALKYLFDNEEQKEIEKWFSKKKKLYFLIPNFKGKAVISKLFYNISRFFKPLVGGWGAFEREIGNT